MHLVIISCSPRAQKDSNTSKIIERFKAGFEKESHTTEVHYLFMKNTWASIREAFDRNEHILFAVPLFVECIPGIMLEFLETLKPKEYAHGAAKTKIGFILQGGFAEASQLRCGEQYLECLPEHLNCEYTGALIKGNMFVLGMLNDKGVKSLAAPFVDMGAYYGKHGVFPKDIVSEFAKPEYYSKTNIFFFTLLSPLQKLFFSLFARKRGCKASLNAKPYH
ncbi:MAG: hypothetical protein FWF87_01845 [Synergistaceae bacterium]|nr:hypothetical protein [Synergistaceae bacterium]